MGNPHPGRRPVTQDDYDRVRELHAEGKARNQIAKEMGRSGHTISRIAGELGLSFERNGATAAATEARKTQAAASRSRLQTEALEGALRMTRQLFAETTVYNIGGKDNVYTAVTHPEPPHRDKRDLAMAVQAMTNSALRLAEFDKAAGGDDEKGMLGLLRDQLRTVRDMARAPADDQ